MKGRVPIKRHAHASQMPALPPGQMFLTKAQMAALLQVSIRTITAMMAKKEIPFLRLKGRLIRFCLDDVHRHLIKTALVSSDAPAKEGA